MSNVNYTGSSAQRFMNFNSKIQSVKETKTDLFNTIEIFVPAGLAAANIKDYSGEGLTETTPIVKTVTADNYNEVLTGALFEQWKYFFKEGTNLDGTIYLIVFYDTGFKAIVDPKELVKARLDTPIANIAITSAFNKVYNLAYFKTLFSDNYTGIPAGGEEPYTAVNKMFDMQLCLDALCEKDNKLSSFLAYYTPDLGKISFSTTEGGALKVTDSNVCNVLTVTKVDEIKAAVSFETSDATARAKYFWGYLNLLGGNRTALTVHNGVYVDPIRLGVWMERKNSSGTYIGNKLAKIKLTDNSIKPTGLPNIIEEDVNDNLDPFLAEIADDKHVAYLLSISDASQNHSQIIDDKSISGFPLTANMMAKFIDYTCSQSLAEYNANLRTLDRPVLVNNTTYTHIQNLVANIIRNVAKTGRLENVKLTFPPYDEAKKGNTFVGAASWSAVYIDDLAGVNISGSITIQ